MSNLNKNLSSNISQKLDYLTIKVIFNHYKNIQISNSISGIEVYALNENITHPYAGGKYFKKDKYIFYIANLNDYEKFDSWENYINIVNEILKTLKFI